MLAKRSDLLGRSRTGVDGVFDVGHDPARSGRGVALLFRDHEVVALVDVEGPADEAVHPRRAMSTASVSVGAMARIIVQPTRGAAFGPSTRCVSPLCAFQFST